MSEFPFDRLQALPGPSLRTPNAVKSMIFTLAERLAKRSLSMAEEAHRALLKGDRSFARTQIARAEAYQEAADLVLTIGKNL